MNIVNALQNCVKAVKNIPPAPIFDASAVKAEFVKMKLPEKFIESAIEELRAKHEETHGNNEEKFARIVLAELSPALGGIDSLASICKAMKNEELEANSIKFTKGELNDKENAKAQAFIKQVQKLYNDGKQVSEIQKEIKFYSYQTLYQFVKENETLFPPRK